VLEDNTYFFYLVQCNCTRYFFFVAQRKSTQKEDALVRSPLEIFTLKIKFISCNVQKLAYAQTFELKAHLINFIFNS